MAVTTFRSTDASAPVLSGTAGSLVDLFDTCLVGSGTAYGALPKKGWTKPQTGTSKGVYTTVDGIGFLRVMHDGTQAGSGGLREAVVRGAEGATTVDALIDPFPLVADVSDTNCVWRVSTTVDATARPWVLVADANWFILTVEYSGTLSDLYIFGRYSRTRSANSWPYIVNTRDATTAADHRAGTACSGYVASVANARMYAMRSADGVTKAPVAIFLTESSNSSIANGIPGRTGPRFPDSDGIIFQSSPQLWINNGPGATVAEPAPSGFFPNLWSPMHNTAEVGSTAVYGDTFTAVSYDPSANFLISGGKSDAAGKWIIETTDTWQDPLA